MSGDVKPSVAANAPGRRDVLKALTGAGAAAVAVTAGEPAEAQQPLPHRLGQGGGQHVAQEDGRHRSQPVAAQYGGQYAGEHREAIAGWIDRNSHDKPRRGIDGGDAWRIGRAEVAGVCASAMERPGKARQVSRTSHSVQQGYIGHVVRGAKKGHRFTSFYTFSEGAKG